jgi:16S rRNA (cytidine1402-2'-O)-methyltransferase
MPFNTLFVVPTPLGNLEDITLRALRVLRESRLIAAEDTRTTRVLLNRYEILTPLTAYHEHNKLSSHKLGAIFDALTSGDVALVSDAGTPGISDPGYELIREALARGVKVVPLPGASAVITALVGSGLPSDGFVYLGFLPRKDKALRDLLTDLAAERRTLVAYESPNRLVDTLQVMLDVLGNRPVAVARELTKLYEEFQRGTATEVLAHFRAHDPRGEITVVIGGMGNAENADESPWDEARVLAAMREKLAAGLTRKEAAKAVAARAGWDSREVYRLSLDIS